MKSIYTIIACLLFSFGTKAQTYAGTVSNSKPSPGSTFTINFSLTSGQATSSLVIYVYNSNTLDYTKLPTTSTFNGLAFYTTYTVPEGTPNNTILQFAVGTNTPQPTYYGTVSTSTVLPVIFQSFTAAMLGTDKVSLKWVLASTDGMDKSIVYRSVDGTNFLPIDTIKGSASVNSYGYIDPIGVNSGTYFYRIACVSLDGVKIITSTLHISKIGNGASTPKILNNAHIGNTLYLSGIDLSDYKNGEINIFDAMGRKYQAIAQNNNTIITNNLTKGIYYLKIGNNQPVSFIAQ